MHKENRARVDSFGLKNNNWASETVFFLLHELSKEMVSDFVLFF